MNRENKTTMDEISISNMPERFVSDSVTAKENRFTEMYTRTPLRAAREEPEFDRELLAENFKRMKKLKSGQRAVFTADCILFLIGLSSAVPSLINIIRAPIGIFNIFPVIGVVVASFVTVAYLDNREVLKRFMIVFAAAGLLLGLLLFDLGYTGYFGFYALQMFLAMKFADEDDYLRTQLGYPYFQENMIPKQYSKFEYRPERELNFETSGNMDEI